MKKAIKFLFATISFLLLLTSCGERGPIGPEGPRGPQGPAGPEILPSSFEFNATLLPSNGFEFFSDIPGQIEVLDSDVVLAFVLEDYIPEEDLEVWRQLPLTEFNSRGTLLFSFDFTLVDVRVFLEANYNLTFSDGFEDVLIRAVHIPSNFAAKMKPDAFQDIQSPDELEEMIGHPIQRIN